MTLYLALDQIDGHSIPGQGTGAARIAGINPTRAGLVAAGFTPAKGYDALTVQTIDETDSAVWDSDCEPGWYLVGNAVQQAQPLTPAQLVARDIVRFRAAVLREERDIEVILAQEALAPHTDSGHLWSNDVIHAIAKPHIRLLEMLLAAAKVDPSTRANYSGQLAVFLATAQDPGLLGIYKGATKSVWRPKRDGLFAYGYDTATGGVRQTNGQDVRAPVTYPTGLTVVTWDAISAVEAL